MTKASDIAIDEGPLRYLPGGVRPFALLARWDRPIGTWLLLWPCLWGLVLAERAGAGGAVGTAEMAGWLIQLRMPLFLPLSPSLIHLRRKKNVPNIGTTW